jgi:ferredoxin
MEIVVHREKCTALGICESLAPGVFEIDDHGELVLKHAEISDAESADVEAAIAGRPTEALRLRA